MKFKIICFTLLFILSNLANSFSKNVSPLAKHGVLDLRKQSLDQSISLSGEWKFYWKKLIIPTDTTKGIFVSFPVKWNDLSINGKRLPAFGYATYQLTLLLPKTKDGLRIEMPDVYCAYSLFLNGKLVAENGKVAFVENVPAERLPSGRRELPSDEVQSAVDHHPGVFLLLERVRASGGR